MRSRVLYKLSRTQVSLHLLRTLTDTSEDDVALFEQLVAHLRLPSGVFRTTYRERFRDLDPVVNTLLFQAFPSGTELRVGDWAASSCLTSCEWVETLFPLFPKLRFEASDIILYLAEYENTVSHERFVFEPDGSPLQYIRPPFVVRMDSPEDWIFPVNRWLYFHAKRRWHACAPLCKTPDGWANHPFRDEPVERIGYALRKLPLIHPQALELMRKDFRFTIRQQSAFDSPEEPLHVIRSMNIFNHGYFPQDLLEQGVRNIIRSLRPNGIWIVGRTTGQDLPANDVTIFQKNSSGTLEARLRIGKGSEIEHLMMSATVN